jgi:type II secretory pathway pseudopilin PulG
MLVVIALAAILATAVAVSLAGTYRTARAEDVAGRIGIYDRLAREHARRFGRPSNLVFDLGRGTVTRTGSGTFADPPENRAASLHLPSGFHMARMLTPAGSATSGEVSIPVSSSGQTRSYALLLTDPKGEQSWIITAGLTGKTLAVRDEREVEAIFAALAGNDASSSERSASLATPLPAPLSPVGDDAR